MKIVVEARSAGASIRSRVFESGEFTVGSGNCGFVLQYPTVSRHHARIRVTDDRVTVADLGSRNGTWLASAQTAGAVGRLSAREARQRKPPEALTPGEEARWDAGGSLHIGPFQLTYSRHDDSMIPLKESDTALQITLELLAETYANLLTTHPLDAAERLRARAVKEHALEESAVKSILERIHHEFHGDGPLRTYLQNPQCREILVNGHGRIFLDCGGGLFQSKERFLSEKTFEAWAVRTANACGRRLDLQHPVCEATLPDGARFHAVLAPVSASGLSVAIRRFGSAPIREADALEHGWIAPEALEILKLAVRKKQSAVISGGTSSGKTSLLNFLCQYFDPSERILTVEDTVELAPPVGNLVQLQAKKPNADGVGEVNLRALVQCALRMRPDRIIVGECRGDEVLEMLQALNTGHPGSLTTVHANSTAEALHRLELLCLLGARNLSIEAIRSWIHSSIDVFVHVERDANGHRHVAEIAVRSAARVSLGLGRGETDGFHVVYQRTAEV